MDFRHRFFHFVVFALCAGLLSGCTTTELASHYIKKIGWGQEQQKTAGSYKIGKPYRVGGVWYYPQEDFRLVETGIASWYGPDFHGKRTANGEIYDQNELTAAHRTLQMPSLVRVTNLENGRSVVVRINDRGPFLHGRVIDVSKRSAELLGFVNRGTARVRVEVLEKESRQLAAAAQRGVDTAHMKMADLQKMPPPTTEKLIAKAQQPVVEAKPAQIAYLENDAEALPESLRTPTITVEDLNAPGGGSGIMPAPTWENRTSSYTPPVARNPVPGHTGQGNRYLPDPVVTTVPVKPTGIFVQAGAFSVYDNAANLSKKLSSIAPTVIEPVRVSGRQLYRVKLGPLPSVSHADTVLAKVISAGQGGAKVIK